MTSSTDVVTQPEPPIVDRDLKPDNGTRVYTSPEQPWTRDDELQAEALANG